MILLLLLTNAFSCPDFNEFCDVLNYKVKFTVEAHRDKDIINRANKVLEGHRVSTGYLPGLDRSIKIKDMYELASSPLHLDTVMKTLQVFGGFEVLLKNKFSKSTSQLWCEAFEDYTVIKAAYSNPVDSLRYG